MPASKAQQKAVAKYMAANYDEIKIRVPKSQKATVEAAAQEVGESVNQYTQRALLARMGLTAWPEKEETQNA